MSLDNAQFISELSITDPPGTDAVAEGDDHIRTTKRATQQSFPNVDAAVPQTAAQMGQMAIKNEVNTFTQDQFITRALDVNAGLFMNSGLVAAPSHSFNLQTDMGMFRAGALNLGFAVDGVLQLSVRDDQVRFTNKLVAVDGTELAPVYTFLNQPDMGMFRLGANDWGFSIAGVNTFRIRPGFIDSLALHNFADDLRANDGSAASPAYSFTNNTNMGMYRVGSNVLGFSTVGVERLRLSSGNMTVGSSQIHAQSGTISLPGYSWAASTGAGWFLASGRTSYGHSGTNPFALAANAVFLFNLPTVDPGVLGQLWRNPTAPGFVAVSI